MRPRVLLIIAIRLMGLWFAITGTCSLIDTTATYFVQYSRLMPLAARGLAPQPAGFLVSQSPLAIAQLVSGLLLVFGAPWLARELHPRSGKQCGNCGYDLSHSKGPRCPECGDPNEFAASVPAPGTPKA